MIDYERSREAGGGTRGRSGGLRHASKMMRFQEASPKPESEPDQATRPPTAWAPPADSAAERSNVLDPNADPDEAQAAVDAQEGAPADTTPLTEADIAALLQGRSDSEIAVEQPAQVDC